MYGKKNIFGFYFKMLFVFIFLIIYKKKKFNVLKHTIKLKTDT